MVQIYSDSIINKSVDDATLCFLVQGRSTLLNSNSSRYCLFISFFFNTCETYVKEFGSFRHKLLGARLPQHWFDPISRQAVLHIDVKFCLLHRCWGCPPMQILHYSRTLEHALHVEQEIRSWTSESMIESPQGQNKDSIPVLGKISVWNTLRPSTLCKSGLSTIDCLLTSFLFLFLPTRSLFRIIL